MDFVSTSRELNKITCHENTSPNTVHQSKLLSAYIFPNPTKGLLQIEFDLNETQFIEIEVYDFTGKKIVEQNERNVFNQRIPIDLTQFGEGVYTVKINIGESFLVKRIVKHD